ncbi:MAG TPA: PDZ domain-containing protein [Candidatus Binatus sp.]|nr:PDZ domain-containing protein [Candidatus Binatus sp.]
MGKNGGKANDTILTLEEALVRFKRRRETGELPVGEGLSASGIQLVNLAAPVAPETRGTTELELEAAMAAASTSAHLDEATAGTIPSGDVVAMIDGIPRTLEDLERMAAAEDAYKADFPETEDDLDNAHVDIAAIANRHALIRDYAFTAMGSALMILVAFLITRVPTVHQRPNVASQSIPTPAPAPALKASTLMSEADDLITSLVTVPSDSTSVQASTGLAVKSDKLEAKIKDQLKSRAFSDIGVSVSKKGDAYLAGEVYSLNEAKRIAQIVHRVSGVNGVHFAHPDLVPANGPAYFGVVTAAASDVWGAKVKKVIIGSPADKAGVQAGDVISEFDGNTVPDSKYLDLLIAHYTPGQRVQIRVWHAGQPEYLLARLGELTTVASR